jgi:hypothetical protein
MQTPSQPPSTREAELAAAIQQFWIRLQIASSYDPASQDSGRSSARVALIAVMEFLAVLYPKLSPLPLALQDLLQGLTDLDRGTVIPLLTRSKKRGRRPNELADELFRAIAAAAMTSLMKSPEMDRDLAARKAFTDFLKSTFGCLIAHTTDGSIHYVCMDWRHISEMMAAGNTSTVNSKTLLFGPRATPVWEAFTVASTNSSSSGNPAPLPRQHHAPRPA